MDNLLFETKDEQISMRIGSDMKREIVALAFVWKDEGEYSKAIRKILNLAVPEHIKNLDEKQKKEFDQILENLKIIETQKRKKILEEEKKDGNE